MLSSLMRKAALWAGFTAVRTDDAEFGRLVERHRILRHQPGAVMLLPEDVRFDGKGDLVRR